MRWQDLARYAFGSVRAHRQRSLLTALGIAVGIAAVLLLTSIGSGVQRFVLAEFTQFGTNLIAIAPGKTTTAGISGALVSNVRPLSLDDAAALAQLPDVLASVALVQGNAAVEFGRYSRRVMVIGAGHQAPDLWQMYPALGRFLPDDDPLGARAFAVLGAKLRKELFAAASPLGKRVRIGGERYRVIGVMEPKGQLLGFDLDDTVYIPSARAMAMFNLTSLHEIDLLFRAGSDGNAVAESARQLLIQRHGTDDVTITTQEQMMDVLGDILAVLTAAVGALGGISLVVGAIGILTIMTIAVRERRGEIGLLRALGARRGQVLGLFVAEAVLLASLGGLAGLLIGAGGAQLIGLVAPDLPVHTPWQYVLGAEAGAALIGLLAGGYPAWRAARLDPLEALRAE